MSPKVAIIIYSMFGRIDKRKLLSSEDNKYPHSNRTPISLVAASVKQGIEASGGAATIYQYVSSSSSMSSRSK